MYNEEKPGIPTGLEASSLKPLFKDGIQCK